MLPRKLRLLMVLTAALVVGAISGTSRTIMARQADSAADALSTLHVLEQTAIPVSDPIDLARRLRGVTSIPTPPDHPLHVYQVGDQTQFWAVNSDTNTTFQLTAELVYVTPHLFMWFEVGSHPDMNAVKSSSDAFENGIYPTVHKYFGSEHSPGIDGDVHLYILNAHNLGSSVGGYFSSVDTYPNVAVKTSNQHNMVYINLDAGEQVGTSRYDGTLTHEFEHLVQNAVRPSRESWLDEGLAETARLLNGYADSSFAPTFLFAPDTQLDGLDASPAPQAGEAYLFVAYFAQRFGSDNLKLLVVGPHDGLFAFDDGLQKLNTVDPLSKQPITTTDLYADWQAANIINTSTVGDGRYGYAKVPEQLPAAKIANQLQSGQHAETTNQYGTLYLAFTQSGTYTFNFQGQPTIRVIPTNAYGGTHFWWSGRQDKSDARLTHDFDLSQVKAATLDFWIWHWIEKDYDYGYVEVSTDGGSTWKALAASSTDSTDPNGLAYGPGYTGSSGVPNHDDSQPGQWIEQKIDLTPYVGQPVKVRFEYITDDAFTRPGMAIDDVQIPEIGYSTNAENDDGGWQSEGWTRFDNLLPETYLVQEIDFGPTPNATTVKRLLSPADGITGQWTLAVGKNVKRVVIAVSGMTRFSNEPAPFSYTVTPAN